MTDLYEKYLLKNSQTLNFNRMITLNQRPSYPNKKNVQEFTIQKDDLVKQQLNKLKEEQESLWKQLIYHHNLYKSLINQPQKYRQSLTITENDNNTKLRTNSFEKQKYELKKRSISQQYNKKFNFQLQNQNYFRQKNSISIDNSIYKRRTLRMSLI